MKHLFFIFIFLFSYKNFATEGKREVSFADLKKLPFEIYAPTYLPTGYKMGKIFLEDTSYPQASGKDIIYSDYEIQYCNSSKVCFHVESAYGEIGDGPGSDKTKHGTTKALGKYTLEFFPPHSEGNNTDDDYVISNWLPNKAMVDALKNKKWPQQKARYYHIRADNLSLEEVAKILESLKLQ